MSKPFHLLIKLILCVIILSVVMRIVASRKGMAFIAEGPGFQIAEATRSLWNNGSLSPQHYREVEKAASSLSARSSTFVWQDVYTLGVNGALYPKHSLFSVIAAIPFYAVFGESGFWLFHEFMFVCLVAATFGVVYEITGAAFLWTTLLATCLFSQTLFQVASYGYDFHEATLVTVGLYISLRRPALGALLMNLAAFVRPSALLISLPLSFAWCLSYPAVPRLARSALGTAAALFVFGATQRVLYGSWLTTSYQHLPGYVNGEMVQYEHPLWSLDTLVADWPEKLHGQHGLLPWNVALLALPFVLAQIRGEWHRAFLLLLLTSSLVSGLQIFAYPMWNASVMGNRFLTTAISLYSIAFICVVGQFGRRIGAPSAKSSATPLVIKGP